MQLNCPVQTNERKITGLLNEVRGRFPKDKQEKFDKWVSAVAAWFDKLTDEQQTQLRRAAVIWGVPTATINKFGGSALYRILAIASFLER